MKQEEKSQNNEIIEDIDWEKRFELQDKKLQDKIEKGEIKLNDKERYICDGCE